MLHTDKAPHPQERHHTEEEAKASFEAPLVITPLLWVFICVLPSNNSVSLMNQRDGQIQTVVRELVLRVGATKVKKHVIHLKITQQRLPPN